MGGCGGHIGEGCREPVAGEGGGEVAAEADTSVLAGAHVTGRDNEIVNEMRIKQNI